MLFEAFCNTWTKSSFFIMHSKTAAKRSQINKFMEFTSH